MSRIIPILYYNKENCCGCSACFAICKMGAIIMVADEEGFLYPKIMSDKCVKCYKCLSVCSFKMDQVNKGYISEGEN